MQNFQLTSVSSPSVEFEVGGHIVKSKVISDVTKTPNFDDVLFMDLVSVDHTMQELCYHDAFYTTYTSASRFILQKLNETNETK